MELNKGHILTAWVILGAYMDFEKEFERDMRVAKMDETQIKKILMNIKLMAIPRKEWTTKDVWILQQIVSYIFFQLVHHKDDLDECLRELEVRAKRELVTGIMKKDDYFIYRRNGFQLKKMCEYLIEKDDVYELIYNDEIFTMV